MKDKRRTHNGIILALAVLAAAWALPASADVTVKIGIINTYSGNVAEFGDQIDKGLKLYVAEHEKELPPGVKVELVIRDDGGPNPELAKRLAQELVTRDHVQFLAGVVWSPNAAAIAPLATEAKVPFVNMNAVSAALTRSTPYMIRTSVTTWQEAYPLGKWLALHSAKRAYTAVSDYAAGHDAEAAFVKGFTDAGGTVVGSVQFPLRHPDFVPYLQRMKDIGGSIDVVFVFVPGIPQNVEIVKAAADLDLRGAGIKLASTQDLVPDEELVEMGDPALGVITAGVYSIAGERPANQAFLTAWNHAYGNKSLPNYGSVSGWDGMAAIYAVIKQTGGKFDGDQAMKLLSNWKSPDSPRGPIAIDPVTRDIVQNVYIRRVERVKGRLENVEIDTIPQVKDPWKELNPPK